MIELLDQIDRVLIILSTFEIKRKEQFVLDPLMYLFRSQISKGSDCDGICEEVSLVFLSLQ